MTCRCVLSPDAFTSALCSASRNSSRASLWMAMSAARSMASGVAMSAYCSSIHWSVRASMACFNGTADASARTNSSPDVQPGRISDSTSGWMPPVLAVMPRDSRRSITSCGMSSMLSRLARSMRAAEMPPKSWPCPGSCSGSQLRMLEYCRSPRSSALNLSSSSSTSPLPFSSGARYPSSVSASTIQSIDRPPSFARITGFPNSPDSALSFGSIPHCATSVSLLSPPSLAMASNKLSTAGSRASLRFGFPASLSSSVILLVSRFHA